MSDKLKIFVAENEAEFDAMPQTGHFDRFKQKQNQQVIMVKPKFKAEPKLKEMPMLMKIAAIFVLVFGIGWLFFNLGKLQGSQEFAASSGDLILDYSNELSDAEQFFTQQVDLKKKEVLAFSNANNTATKQIMLELEKLELQYLDLKEELAINNNNEQILNAMIENYRMRLSVLERLLKQLKKSNTIKQKHHENIQA